MSLRVWLPLNGNLENQGLSNVTVTNNGATSDNNGKIGKCYSFGSSKRITVSQPANLSTTAASLSCWVNLSAWGSSYDSLVNLSTGTGWNDTRLAFVRNNTANRICFCVANGSTFNTTVMTSDLPLNTWTHLTGTFDGSTIKIYVNGILNNSAATTFNSLVYGSAVLNLGSWSNGNNYPINGKLNDVRIYDHCLSAKEVKDLAKGLVLHYRLAGPGQENLIKNSQLATSWGIGDVQQCNNPTGYSFDGECIKITSGTSGNYNNGYGLLLRASDISYSAGEKLTFSVDIKGSGQHIGLWFLGTDGNWWTGANFHTYFTQYNDWTRVSVTGTVPSGAPRVMLGLHSGLSNNTLYAKNMKLERGSIATPWCPNPADTLYSTMGYNNNIEYDCSGYRRNGTKSGTITWDIDSPRYTTSYNFSKSGYIYNNSFGVTTKEYTISLWVKLKPATSQHFLFGTFDSWTGNGIGFYRDANQLGLNCVFKSNGESSWGGLGTGGLSANTWYMVTYTSDGTIIKRYLNGIYKDSLTYGKGGNTLNPVFYIANSKFNGTPASENEEALISDVRFYATALSAEDIAELYHSAVIVDNTGKSYAYEYFEAN